MRDTIILAGGFALDAMGASAVRALGLAALYERCGYEVLVLGKFAAPPSDTEFHERLINAIRCRDIRQPVPGRAFASYITSAEPLIAAAEHLGPDRVRAITLYNYPARGVFAAIRACRARGIAPVLDCTEWPLWEGGRVLRNLWRLAGIETRMRLLTRLAGNVICASEWFRQKVPDQHSVVLPFVLDTARPEWRRAPAPPADRPVRLVYSGSPGLGMVKDRLPPMIAALGRLADEGRAFAMDIAGMTAEAYLATMPGHRAILDRLGARLRFLGRIPHADSLALLRGADFSVFFRRPDRVAHTGFATKFVEAATLGVPIVTNPTSDIPRYLDDGVTGILAAGWEAEAVADALRRAVEMSPGQRAAMVAACRARDPFALEPWIEPARAFLADLRGLDD